MYQTEKPSPKQALFQNIFIGTLLYSVVLGFFNDYTDFLETSSYSSTFAAAIVMQVLTFATLSIKDIVKGWFDGYTGKLKKAGLAVSIWLILFISKFVFLVIIDLIFQEDVEISGFGGLLLIVLCMTIIQESVRIFYNKLK
jgi:hypothetical protein